MKGIEWKVIEMAETYEGENDLSVEDSLRSI